MPKNLGDCDSVDDREEQNEREEARGVVFRVKESPSINKSEPDERYRCILSSLERQFPGKMLLDVPETAGVFGLSPRTVYNKTGRRSKQTFIVKPVRACRKPAFRLTDIARALASL